MISVYKIISFILRTVKTTNITQNPKINQPMPIQNNT